MLLSAEQPLAHDLWASFLTAYTPQAFLGKAILKH
jgi:hypothetical protein